MGDSFPLRIVLPVSYFIQMLVFGLIAFTGFVGGEFSYVQFFIWFAILGLV